MRSNDAFLGLPHDIFAFTMLQEVMARSLGVELGSYKHMVGSLHLYENNRNMAEQYIKEGWQSMVSMPSMPVGDPWVSIDRLLEVELKIRKGDGIKLDELKIDKYWMDLAFLLQIFQLSKVHGNEAKIMDIEKLMSSDAYKIYIQKRQDRALKNAPPEQLDLS